MSFKALLVNGIVSPRARRVTNRTLTRQRSGGRKVTEIDRTGHERAKGGSHQLRMAMAVKMDSMMMQASITGMNHFLRLSSSPLLTNTIWWGGCDDDHDDNAVMVILMMMMMT